MGLFLRLWALLSAEVMQAIGQSQESSSSEAGNQKLRGRENTVHCYQLHWEDA